MPRVTYGTSLTHHLATKKPSKAQVGVTIAYGGALRCKLGSGELCSFHHTPPPTHEALCGEASAFRIGQLYTLRMDMGWGLDGFGKWRVLTQ